MEPTNLIYLPDGMVLDPAAVAAIHPASASAYLYYRLLGDPVAYAVEAESPEHALELRAYMVACKELATPSRALSMEMAPTRAATKDLDGDVHVHTAAAGWVAEEAQVTRERGPSDFVARWAEWWGDREGYYTANPDKWLTGAEDVCRHFFDEGRAGVDGLKEELRRTKLAANIVHLSMVTASPDLRRQWQAVMEGLVVMVSMLNVRCDDAAPDFVAPARTRAIELIAVERAKQVQEWGDDHDDDHDDGVLAVRGAELAVDQTDERLSALYHEIDGWGLVKKYKHDEVRSLTIAGALIAAELDRVLRATGDLDLDTARGEDLAATIGPTSTHDSIPMGLLNATWSGDTEFPSLRLANGRLLVQAELAAAVLAAIDELTEDRRCSAELANDITEAMLPLRASLEAR